MISSYAGKNVISIPYNNNPEVIIAIISGEIYSNGKLGIDLDPGGVTANDQGDGDTGAKLL